MAIFQEKMWDRFFFFLIHLSFKVVNYILYPLCPFETVIALQPELGMMGTWNKLDS